MIGAYTSLRGGNYPSQNMALLLRYPTIGNTTKGYVNLAATGSGTSGSNTITASSTEASLIQAGEKLRIGGTDIYTVASVSTVTITTVETLTSTYTAAAMALDRVSQWNDLSGLGNHATQSSALVKPTFNPAQLNSLAALTFDGANSLILPSALYSISNSGNTMFAIIKRSTEAGVTEYVVAGSISGTQAFNIRYNSNAGEINYKNRSSFGNSITSTGNTNTNFQIVTGQHATATGQSITVNNTNANTDTTNGENVTLDALLIGNLAGTLYFTGSITLLLLYSRVLSAYEISQIQKTLARETAITIS